MNTPIQNTGKSFEKFVRRLRLESLSLAILMIALTYYSSAPLWILPASFLLFDISIVGYAINNKIGSLSYNFMHNSTFPTLLIALGLVTNTEWVAVLGFCWTFHISIDRTLGFGLKHERSFRETHLGKIGNPKSTKSHNK